MQETLLNLDHAVYDWFTLLHSDTLTSFFKLITQFGNWKVIIPVVIAITFFLYFRNKQHSFVLPVWLSLASASAITYVLKLFFARPRPYDSLVFEPTFSFPSGHATLAVAVYGLLIYLALKNYHANRIRNTFILFAVTLIILIGASRLYLGAHYISDVLVGYGIGCVGILLGAYTHSLKTKFAFI